MDKSIIKTENEYLSIAELNFAINYVLGEELKNISFRGEISEFTCAPSGHCYFTLKDSQSQLNAVMWRSVVSRLGFRPQIGDDVICVGTPDVYAKTGRLQMVLQHMTPAGEGALRRKFEELKRKLEQEGFFALDRKRSLPFLPKAVGVVTSKTGAVIHDIMVKIRERMPQIPVFLVDARVQGEGSAEEIAAGIKLLNRSELVDVIIVARGGGSLEDLWSFNEEVVVKAVFASKIPIVSGVGHEVDVSLCDLAADVRAPTPTAAAEMVVPKKHDLEQCLIDIDQRFQNYDRWLQPKIQDLDFVTMRFDRQMNSFMKEAYIHLNSIGSRIIVLHPKRIIEQQYFKVNGLKDKILMCFKQYIMLCERKLADAEHSLEKNTPYKKIMLEQERLSGIEARLENLAPKKVLQRGYAIIEHDGKLICRSRELISGSKIKITLSDGKLEARTI